MLKVITSRTNVIKIYFSSNKREKLFYTFAVTPCLPLNHRPFLHLQCNLWYCHSPHICINHHTTDDSSDMSRYSVLCTFPCIHICKFQYCLWSWQLKALFGAVMPSAISLIRHLTCTAGSVGEESNT